MDRFLPQFPLNIVVFPGNELNLHIFEERYKQLIDDCRNDKITFGIPTVINGKLMDIGTEIELKEISKTHSNGSKDVKTKAIGKYRILDYKEVAENKLYGTAKVETIPDQFDPLPKINEEIFELLNRLFKILKIGKPVPKFDDSFNMYLIAQKVGLNHDQEYEFLQIDSESKRQIYIFNHLSKLIPVVTEIEKLKEKVKLNGHFKELKPPFF